MKIMTARVEVILVFLLLFYPSQFFAQTINSGGTAAANAGAFIPAGWKTVTRVCVPANAGSIELWPYGGAYPSGTKVRANAIPKDGYAFVRWEGAVAGTTTQFAGPFALDGDKTVQAVFAPIDAPSQTVSVTTAQELINAISAAAGGTMIICEDGTYTINSTLTITKQALPTAPLIIKARNRGRATITGSGKIILSSASNVVIEGFAFLCNASTIIDLKNAVGCRITRNTFQQGTYTGYQTWVSLSGTTGHNNRIDHNRFAGKRTMGNFVGTTTTEGVDLALSMYDVIDRNIFYDIGPDEGNGKEAMRLGNSWISMASGYYLVESNYFELCDGDPEVISNKSCDNIYRWNTFINCWGSLCLRHGNRCVVDGNSWIRPDSIINWAQPDKSIPIDRRIAGLRTYGDRQVIINNYFCQTNGGTTGLGTFVLCSGDVNWVETNYPPGDLNKCNAADSDFVAFNTFVDNPRSTLDIGFTSGGLVFPANAITLTNNLLAMRLGRNPGQLIYLPSTVPAPTNFLWKGNLGFIQGTVKIGNYLRVLTNDELRMADPALQKINGRWTVTAASPAIGAASNDSLPFMIVVPWDIDGQPRTSNADIGCDQLSSAPSLNKLLVPADVGPDANDEPLTGIRDKEQLTEPAGFELYQNYPNPFNPETRIKYEVGSREYGVRSKEALGIRQEALVVLKVYDVLGREVAVLVNEEQAPGIYEVKLHIDGLPSGTLFYELRVGEFRAVRKMLFLK